MKTQGHGQAAILQISDYQKIRKILKSKRYRLLVDIAWYTGERWGAVCQLRVADVYDDGGNVRPDITFRASTCKASPDDKRQTRTIPVHPQLEELLAAHAMPDGEWLFESRVAPGQPITLRAADLMFRGAVEAAGLSHKGFSTFSTRLTFINRLWQAGIDLHTIQLLTGHSDIKSLIRYIEPDPERIKKAIAVL